MLCLPSECSNQQQLTSHVECPKDLFWDLLFSHCTCRLLHTTACFRCTVHHTALCVSILSDGMAANVLQLKGNKTEAFVSGPEHRKLRLTANDTSVAKNLRVTVNSHFESCISRAVAGGLRQSRVQWTRRDVKSQGLRGGRRVYNAMER